MVRVSVSCVQLMSCCLGGGGYGRGLRLIISSNKEFHFQIMSRQSGSRSPSPVATELNPASSPPPSSAAGTASPVLSLSPLQSPVDTGSHAEWLEESLLADMSPDDKWGAAVAKAPPLYIVITVDAGEPRLGRVRGAGRLISNISESKREQRAEMSGADRLNGSLGRGTTSATPEFHH